MDYKTHTPQPKCVKKPPFTVEVPGAVKKDGETIPRRNYRTKDGLVSVPAPGINTIWEIVSSSAKKFGNAKATGKRKLIQMHEETKMIKKTVDGKEQEVEKKWQYYELSGYEYNSFSEHEA